MGASRIIAGFARLLLILSFAMAGFAATAQSAAAPSDCMMMMQGAMGAADDKPSEPSKTCPMAASCSLSGLALSAPDWRFEPVEIKAGAVIAFDQTARAGHAPAPPVRPPRV